MRLASCSASTGFSNNRSTESAAFTASLMYPDTSAIGTSGLFRKVEVQQHKIHVVSHELRQPHARVINGDHPKSSLLERLLLKLEIPDVVVNA
jgi:hypothetical protein